MAAEQGVQYATLYIKPLEKIKEQQLKAHRGNFDSFMNIPQSVKPSLNWWVANMPNCVKKVSHGPPQLCLYTDSSLQGWSAYNKTNEMKAGGEWSIQEKQLHINILELKACQLALLSFCKETTNTHVQVYMDNTTSVAYINKGGRKTELNELARCIWFWCIDRNIHLSAAHVAGKLNVEADEMSRKNNDDLEWALSEEVFSKLLNIYPQLDMDLFASRLNHKLDQYVSRRPEPDASAIDAFSITWINHSFYVFVPFSLVSRILQKIEEDMTDMAILIAPLWPTQTWWPCLMNLICGPCLLLPNPQTILQLPHRPERKHPLKKMKLAAFPISGQSYKVKEYQRKLQISSLNHGEQVHKNSMIHTSNHGCFFVRGRIIPLLQI